MQNDEKTHFWPFLTMAHAPLTERWLERKMKKGYQLSGIHGHKFTFRSVPARECYYLFLGNAYLSPDWIRRRKASFEDIAEIYGIDGTLCINKNGSCIAIQLNEDELSSYYWDTRKRWYATYLDQPFHSLVPVLCMLAFACLSTVSFRMAFCFWIVLIIIGLSDAPAKKELEKMKSLWEKKYKGETL